MPTTPSISIYQHPDHVAGLLQQLEGPLLQGERQTHGQDDESAEKAARGLDASVAVKLGVPSVAAFEGRVGAKDDGASDTRHLRTERRELEFVYSQALYLHRVRAVLRSRGLVRAVASAADAAPLTSGDFVEYEAKFAADQVSAALDILTPPLVQQIVRHVRISTFTKATDFGDHQTLQDAMAKFKESLDADLALAGAITEAVRADFRSDKTKEFYGYIGTGDDRVTAVTICDVEHFTVADADRILDGRFTVLGKVSEEVATDRPVLERNKLLDKLDPIAVDEMFASVNTNLDKGTSAMEDQFKVEGQVRSHDNPLNLRLESRVPGPSFKVIPIAIFT
jgi:hypothetical protein